MNESVRLLFLGGIGEVGANLFLLETDDDIIVVDCGIGFPAENQPGIDTILPDISYLAGKKHKIRGLFITHGHEDHIGAIRHVWPDLECPIYATPLTAGLIGNKLREGKLQDRAEIRVFDPDARPKLKAGSFVVEPFRVCHSIPDAVGYGITTPAGLIVHTSDFKLDPTPIDGRETDLALLKEFALRGVKLLISDCVHVESPGHTPSERVIGEAYDAVFAAAPGRVIIATFASLIARVQQVIDVAARHHRQVVLLGRSLEQNTRVALELGYLNDPDGVLIPIREASRRRPEDVVYVVTGSQGEPTAVLSRIANRDHHEITVGDGDTVIVSASPIPGNETAVYRIIDQLFSQGAKVRYPATDGVHVSGHASRDELTTMIELTQPEWVLPTHGEARHLALYEALAVETGIDRGRVVRAGVGDVIEIASGGIEIVEHVSVGKVFVEGSAVGVISESVLRDRLSLSQDGIVTIVVAIDSEDAELVAGPVITAHGVSRLERGSELEQSLCDEVQGVVQEFLLEDAGGATRPLESRIRAVVGSHLHAKTRRRPTLVPIVMKI